MSYDPSDDLGLTGSLTGPKPQRSTIKRTADDMLFEIEQSAKRISGVVSQAGDDIARIRRDVSHFYGLVRFAIILFGLALGVGLVYWGVTRPATPTPHAAPR